MFTPVDTIPHNYDPMAFRAKNSSGFDFELDLNAGFADIITYGASGNHAHTVNDHRHSVSDHTHTVDNHMHGFNVTIPAISIPTHQHGFSVTIPAVEIPDHTHAPIYGIWKYDKLPSMVTLKIDGTVVPFDGSDGEIDITDYLRKDNSGKVTRDWHTIEASPNDLASINMIVRNRFFIRSHIGGTY